jgi:hypothetical protein
MACIKESLDSSTPQTHTSTAHGDILSFPRPAGSGVRIPSPTTLWRLQWSTPTSPSLTQGVGESPTSLPLCPVNRFGNQRNRSIYHDFVRFSKKSQILKFKFEPNFDRYCWYSIETGAHRFFYWYQYFNHWHGWNIVKPISSCPVANKLRHSLLKKKAWQRVDWNVSWDTRAGFGMDGCAMADEGQFRPIEF